MAIFGDVGRLFGLGTAEQFTTAVTGSPIAGRAAGFVSRGISSAAERGALDIGQATAISTPSQPPAETGMSGERIQPRAYSAGIQPAAYVPSAPMRQPMNGIQPAYAGALIQGGRAVGQVAGSAGKNLFPFLFGGAAAASPYIIDALTGQEKKLRVTRKLKSDVKKAVEMFGADAVADQMGTSIDVVFYILTKKMRNDGPYVTKAAVRKTRATVRKMKTMCDLYDDLRPAAKRRAPTRRAAGATRITTVK